MFFIFMLGNVFASFLVACLAYNKGYAFLKVFLIGVCLCFFTGLGYVYWLDYSERQE